MKVPGESRPSSDAHRALHTDAGHASMPAPTQAATDLRDPAHPGHAEFTKTLREVHYMEAGRGIASGPHSDKVAAALLVQGERDGLR
ncbi:XVIPCD domain-containing protein, partial [Xanthomonas graminis]